MVWEPWRVCGGCGVFLSCISAWQLFGKRNLKWKKKKKLPLPDWPVGMWGVRGIFSSLINVDGPVSLWASVSPGQVVLGCITSQADEQVRKHLFLGLSQFLPQVPLMMAMLCRRQPDKPFLSQTALVTVFIPAEGSLRKRGGHQTLFFCPV